jgi:hypothetical protein
MLLNVYARSLTYLSQLTFTLLPTTAASLLGLRHMAIPPVLTVNWHS